MTATRMYRFPLLKSANTTVKPAPAGLLLLQGACIESRPLPFRACMRALYFRRAAKPLPFLKVCLHERSKINYLRQMGRKIWP